MVSCKSVVFRRVRCENMMFVSRKVNREFEFMANNQEAAQNVGTNHRSRVPIVKGHEDAFKGHTIFPRSLQKIVRQELRNRLIHSTTVGSWFFPDRTWMLMLSNAAVAAKMPRKALAFLQ